MVAVDVSGRNYLVLEDCICRLIVGMQGVRLEPAKELGWQVLIDPTRGVAERSAMPRRTQLSEPKPLLAHLGDQLAAYFFVFPSSHNSCSPRCRAGSD